MKNLLCGLLAVTTLTLPVMRAGAADIEVRGSPTCQDYLAAVEKSKHGDRREASSDVMWFLGYMSGLAIGTQVDILDKAEGDRWAVQWLDIYCHRNPADAMSDAGDVLYGYLRKQPAAGHGTQRT